MGKAFRILLISWSAACAAALLLSASGTRGARLPRAAQSALPAAQHLPRFWHDLRLRLRGPQPARHPIVVVEIDNASLEQLGRWPWRRDYVAFLVDRIFRSGARAVALDILFAEPQRPVPEELERGLRERGLGRLLAPFEFDTQFRRVIQAHRDRLVLAWASESICVPQRDGDDCPIDDPRAVEQLPKDWSRFSLTPLPARFPLTATPMYAAPTVIPIIPEYREVVRHAGFVNDPRDSDGVLRRLGLLLLTNGAAHPSLALQLAQIVRDETVVPEWGSAGELTRLRWSRSGETIPVSRQGLTTLNFRGPERGFPYIPVHEVLSADDGFRDPRLANAIVLVGMSATALGDIVPTPFDGGFPGVEVHATVLDNLLSGDLLRDGPWWVDALLALWALLAPLGLWEIARRRDARTFYAAWLAPLVGLAIADYWLFAARGLTLDIAYALLAPFGGGVLVAIERQLAEQRSRKFLWTAFSKYVSSEVVKLLVRDPRRLSLGGERRELTVMFSDIRSFTTLSESMSAQRVAEFLNEYLSMMTAIVFETGGTLDKYIGDAVMAFWGAPLSQPDHATRACRAAVRMARALEERRADLQRRYGFEIRAGIGLHTGPVSVGNMGSQQSFSYTVLGDTVNIAARLESATKAMGVDILASEATVRAAGPTAIHRRLGKLQLKGKNQSVAVAHLLAREVTEPALRGFAEAMSEFEARRYKQALFRLRQVQRLWGPDDVPTRNLIQACRELSAKRGSRKEWIWDLRKAG